MTTETDVKAPEKASRWEDLVDVYFAPGDLFARRADESWVAPVIMLSVISILLYYIFLPINAVMWEVAMTENAAPGMDAEKIRQGAAMMKYIGGLFLPVGYLIVMLFTAIGLKLVSSLMEPAAEWRQAFLIAAFSMFVTIPQQIVGALLIFLKSGSGTPHMSDVSFGALRFMEKPDPVVRALLGRVDLFAIWAAVLCAVGLVVVVKMPRGKAIATAAITWLFLALPGLVGALLQSRKQ